MVKQPQRPEETVMSATVPATANGRHGNRPPPGSRERALTTASQCTHETPFTVSSQSAMGQLSLAVSTESFPAKDTLCR